MSKKRTITLPIEIKLGQRNVNGFVYDKVSYLQALSRLVGKVVSNRSVFTSNENPISVFDIPLENVLGTIINVDITNFTITFKLTSEEAVKKYYDIKNPTIELGFTANNLNNSEFIIYDIIRIDIVDKINKYSEIEIPLCSGTTSFYELLMKTSSKVFENVEVYQKDNLVGYVREVKQLPAGRSLIVALLVNNFTSGAIGAHITDYTLKYVADDIKEISEITKIIIKGVN
jgi:hypothetical protein